MGHFLLFDIGGGELLVILLFVLIFFGSKGIPDVARTMGRALRQVRDATAQVQHEIEKGAAEVKKGFEEQRNQFSIEPPDHARPQVARGQAPAAPDAGAPREDGAVPAAGPGEPGDGKTGA